SVPGCHVAAQSRRHSSPKYDIGNRLLLSTGVALKFTNNMYRVAPIDVGPFFGIYYL
ncbi:hypothetical protein Ancab_029038, partial [Ancistrocladus abbreviatus]